MSLQEIAWEDKILRLFHCLSASGSIGTVKIIISRHVFSVWTLQKPCKSDFGYILLPGAIKPCFGRIWIQLECTKKCSAHALGNDFYLNFSTKWWHQFSTSETINFCGNICGADFSMWILVLILCSLLYIFKDICQCDIQSFLFFFARLRTIFLYKLHYILFNYLYQQSCIIWNLILFFL